jgi:hypothetical protein
MLDSLASKTKKLPITKSDAAKNLSSSLSICVIDNRPKFNVGDVAARMLESGVA